MMSSEKRLDMPRNVALVGGGHAHIEVIRRWGLDPVADTRLTVFDPNPRPVYSGMVPGFIAGQYARHELEIDLKALCDRARVEFVECAVTSIDARNAKLHLGDGTAIGYHAASLDIGSTVAGVDLPGVREFALPSRPIATLLSEVGNLFGRAGTTSPRTHRLHVIGGGAGGVEIAFCLEARLRREHVTSCEVAIVTSDPVVLEGAAQRLRSRVERALEHRRIRTLVNSSVTAIREDAIELEQGPSLASSGAVWVTGPASHPLASDSGLPVDSRGFVRIRSTLQVQGKNGLFAVGDCASLPGMKKAGVYAVRSGPLVDHNLRAHLRGERLRDYSPQDDFLSLLNLGDGTAIGTKWGVAFEGRWTMWLKDRIDRSFMEKYR
jgi:selenide,water dikinase